MNKPRPEVTVGFFVIVGFVLLTAVVFGVSGIYFLKPGYTLSADFNYVGIIDRGAPVRFAGVKVGEVKSIEILEASQPGASSIRITFFVLKDVRIFENDNISVQGTHIMSEPHIEIEPSANRGRLLKKGDVVKGIDPTSMDELIQHGKEIVQKINNLLGGASDLMQDKNNVVMLKSLLVNASELTASLNQIIKGQETEFRQGMTSLTRSADEFSRVLEKVNKGEGTVGKLIGDDELYRELFDFVQEIKRHPWRLLQKK